MPPCVLGGAGLVMFGMVGVTGTRILGAVDFSGNRNNLFIVAVSVSFGMSPLLASGILLSAIAAVLLNLFFNGLGSTAATRQAKTAATRQAKTAEAHRVFRRGEMAHRG